MKLNHVTCAVFTGAVNKMKIRQNTRKLAPIAEKNSIISNDYSFREKTDVLVT